ncbi:hypothetical protein B0H10DRAFT_643275 [Mycena sp. CBHHK59/15]|nr:hypothetical protein B0H10DRAFT_643275 [Mycena sp. CBHHK59/15]
MNSRSIDPAVIIPPEILAEIFNLCNLRNSSIFNRINMSEAPWLLSHVSHHWRRIALSTPMLWCFLRVNMSTTDSGHFNAHGTFQLVKLFLDRSASCPISFILFCEETAETRPILELLIGASDRWEELDLIAPGAFIESLSPIRGHLHRLRRLALYREDPEVDLEPPHIVDIFAEAQCLRKVTFTRDPPFCVVVPWNQLTEFTTSYCELMPLLNTLRELTQVVTLKLDKLDDTEDHGTVAHLPHLRNLTITSENGAAGHPGDLLDYLIVPALKSLSIECEDLTIVPHLISLVSRSAFTLVSFTLFAYEEFDTSLIGFLKLTPRLTRLCLRGSGQTVVSDELLTQLTRMLPATPPPVIPLLTSLRVQATFNQALLFSLTASRFSPDADDRLLCLKTLELSIKFVDLEPVLAFGLEALAGMGLHVLMVH